MPRRTAFIEDLARPSGVTGPRDLAPFILAISSLHGFLESVEVTEGAGDTVAILEEIVKSFHDGRTELPPIGGVVIIGGYLGRWAGAGIGFGEPLEDGLSRKILILKLGMRLSRVKRVRWIKLLKTLRNFST